MNNETKSLVFCGAVSALAAILMKRMFGIMFGSIIFYTLIILNN